MGDVVGKERKEERKKMVCAVVKGVEKEGKRVIEIDGWCRGKGLLTSTL